VTFATAGGRPETRHGCAPGDQDLRLGKVGRVLAVSESVARQHHGTATFVRDLQLYAGDRGFDVGALDGHVGVIVASDGAILDWLRR
jgi:hypothetical protein